MTTLLAWSAVEVLLREDPAWRPLALTVSVVVALSLLWRRTHPLAAVLVAFGTLIAFDLARVLWIDATGLDILAGLLVLPYSLFRWGAGREAAIGLGVIVVWLAVTLVTERAGWAETAAGHGFFLFSAALGTSIRFHARTRTREIDAAKAREREQLQLDDLSPALYRLAQESVTNARRHARFASRVTVRVVGSPERVLLTVDDDGAPGPPVGNTSGYGLLGMRERATLLGGTFHAGPTAGHGWRVEAMLPRAGGAL